MVVAIPRRAFDKELPKPTAGMQGESLISDPNTEWLRKYHQHLRYLDTLNGLNDIEHNWKIGCICKHLVQEKENKPLYFFLIRWIGGDEQWLSMDDLRLHDPMSLIKYGEQHHLTKKPGWEWITPYLPKEEELQQMVNRLAASKREGPHYKFGVRVPNSVKEALELDKENGNTLWFEAIETELKQICDYDTLHVVENDITLPGYKGIPYHIIFDMKFDGRQ